MKIIQLLLLIPVTLLSQKEFAPLNTVWNYEGHEISCNGNHINYIVEKEEIFHGRDCSIIYAYTSSDLNPNFIKSQDSLIVWEDDNKVYFLEDSIFYLLFDFDGLVGDTITYYEPINKSEFSTNQVIDRLQGPNAYKVVITQLENVIISNMSLRKYETEIISPEDYQYLQRTVIEKIGSLSQNFTGDQTYYVADGCFGGLQCYNNGQIEYKTETAFESSNPSCDILDSTDDINSEFNGLIFPNPTLSEIRIESDENIESIKILNIEGQLIKSHHFVNRINTSDLNSGIYFLKIKQKGSYKTAKFIKK